MDDRCESNLKSSDRLKQEAKDLTYCMSRKQSHLFHQLGDNLIFLKKNSPIVWFSKIFYISLHC